MKCPVVVAFVVVTVLFIGIVDANQECTSDDLVTFVASLPNGLACGGALLTINATLLGGSGSIPESTIESACDDSTCGGEIYRWYLEDCNQPDDAQNIEDLCYRQPDGTYCISFLSSFREASPMAMLQQVLALCSNATATNCPAACGQALQGIIDNFGCCWTSYVDSEALTDATVIGDLAMQFGPAIAAAQACDLSTTDACGAPFTGAAGAVVVINAVVGVALMLAAFLMI